MLGLQWQWQANPKPDWLSLTAKSGSLRLFAQPEPKPGNLYDAPFLLLQKFPALEFTVTAKLELAPKGEGDSAGLIVFGYDYAWLGLKQTNHVNALVLATRPEAVKGEAQQAAVIVPAVNGPVWLRVTVRDKGKYRFSYSLDGQKFLPAGESEITATVGRWVGAKVGVFAAGTPGAAADFDWVRCHAL
jgi:beta-xylosidase